MWLVDLVWVLIIAGAVLSCSHAQMRVERDFGTSCDQAEATARAYLKTRGFTQPECATCANSLKSTKQLLDAQGNTIGTMRIRRDLAGIKAPFWVWSSPLHARVFIGAKPQGTGCRFGLTILFDSHHTMVVVIVPVGERLGLPSNGRLEREYLDAVEAQFGAGR
jgi:hypothetical protein